ncbi:MAG TPA: hypothetical protein VF974_08170 [Patescibacteria group bacterium]
MESIEDDGKSIVAKPGIRVIHMWESMNFIRGTIVRDFGSFAYVKWDDPKYGQTSEDYKVIFPEELLTEEMEQKLRGSSTRGS